MEAADQEWGQTVARDRACRSRRCRCRHERRARRLSPGHRAWWFQREAKGVPRASCTNRWSAPSPTKVVVPIEFGKYVLVVLDRCFVSGLGVPERRLPSRVANRAVASKAFLEYPQQHRGLRGQRSRRCGDRTCRGGGDAGVRCIGRRSPSRKWAMPGRACPAADRPSARAPMTSLRIIALRVSSCASVP
jgi:hypothetical protein